MLVQVLKEERKRGLMFPEEFWKWDERVEKSLFDFSFILLSSGAVKLAKPVSLQVDECLAECNALR